MKASLFNLQYGFNKGLREFGIDGFSAACKEMNENLLGMVAIEVLEKSEGNYVVHKNTQSYLMFLK